eukprot:112125_1
MASEDMKGSDSQFEFDISLKDSSTLVLYVKDKKNLRKFTATYTANTLAAKGLTQSIDKFFKILKTASKNKKDNWSMQYGYSTKPKSKTSGINTKEDQIDLLPTYLRNSDLSQLRKRPKRDDTLYIILSINEDFFSVNTQFKLYEIERPNKKSKSRRTLSNNHAATKSSGAFGPAITDYDDQKIADMEAKIKSLTRDNQVLKRKMEKLESVSGKKQKKMDNEREMRLQANKERFWLKQKLERLQKAIAARLKILGVDFSKVDDITSALDMAFNVIQKLAKELQKKEEAFEDIKSKSDKAIKEASVLRRNKDKLDATIEKQRGVMSDLRKQIADRDRRLSIVAHEKNDKESMLAKQIQDLENELKVLGQEKEKIYDELVDSKAKSKGELDDAFAELSDMRDQLSKAKAENEQLIIENEQIKEENDKLLNDNNELNAKLQDALNQIDELKNDLENEKNKNDLLTDQNDLLADKNNKLKEQIKKLMNDLSKLKELLRKALNIELELKGVLDDTNDLVGNMVLNNSQTLMDDEQGD